AVGDVVRLLRLQVLVADPQVVRRDGEATGAARIQAGVRAVRLRGRRLVAGRARIGERVVALRRTEEQLADVGRAESRRVGAADQDVLDRLPAKTRLAGLHRAEIRILREAAGDVDVDVLQPDHVLDDRDAELEV